MAAGKIFPIHGEGNHEVVEGARLQRSLNPIATTTPLRAVPFPVPGRIFA